MTQSPALSNTVHINNHLVRKMTVSNVNRGHLHSQKLQCMYILTYLPQVLWLYPHVHLLLSVPLLSLTTSSDSCSRSVCSCIFLVNISSSIRCILRFDSSTCSSPFHISKNFFIDNLSLEGDEDDAATGSEKNLYIVYVQQTYSTFINYTP